VVQLFPCLEMCASRCDRNRRVLNSVDWGRLEPSIDVKKHWKLSAVHAYVQYGPTYTIAVHAYSCYPAIVM